jgi:aquaporin Z
VDDRPTHAAGTGGAGHDRAHPAGEALAALEPPAGEFDDPRFQWRRLFAELLGTFLLVLVAAGGAVILDAAHSDTGRIAAVTAPGLMVLATILFMGAVSGAHLNPAVTVAFALRRDFPWRRVPGYVLAQLAGAGLACLLLRALLGTAGGLGATEPGPGYSEAAAFVVEIVLTFGLVSVILGTASGAQNLGPLSAIGVGAYIVLAGLWASPVSGASMNPARSFGPDAVLADFSQYWIYVLGPLVGALLAVGAAWILRGSGRDRTSNRAAQGDLPDAQRDPE